MQRGPSPDFRYALSAEPAAGFAHPRVAKPNDAAAMGTIRSVLFRCNEAEQYLATGIRQSSSDSPTTGVGRARGKFLYDEMQVVASTTRYTGLKTIERGKKMARYRPVRL